MDSIDQIYDSLVSEEAYARLPATLAKAAGARSCTIQRLDANGMLQEIGYSYFTDEMNLYYGANELFRSDVWGTIFADRSLVGRAIPLSAMLGEESYRSSIFYNDFIRHFGDDTGQCAGMMLELADGGYVNIGVHRAFGDREFSPSAVHKLDRLTPHLRRLFALRARLKQTELDAAIARAGFDAINQPAILTDEFGRPVVANRAAEELLAGNDGLALIGGRLAVASTRARLVLNRAIHDAARRRRGRGGACLVERPSGKRALHVIVAPLGLDYRSFALILIDDPDRIPSDLAASLRTLYRLTASEAQVALALGRGLSPEEIAGQRKVSIATVRTQIQNVFRKTDTRRAVQLVKLFARLPQPGED